MGRKNPAVDAYIADAQEFARPILVHIRSLMHRACPEVEEKMKWSFPNFEYKGQMANMAAFKAHCAFGFWKSAVMADPENILGAAEEKAMGQLGRITSAEDLPSDEVMIAYIREAMRLNDEGVKVPKKKPDQAKEVEVPDYFREALEKNEAALITFEKFSPSHKREYLEWITEAKTEATRRKRIATTLEWLEEGKPRNWKYM
ncbi:MAG: YdeI/OmpD-associated family protein [Lewinellaceae bacterium]|nr:YdeI/OmpD-associated family protein [Lewinellaceae bacterium]